MASQAIRFLVFGVLAGVGLFIIGMLTTASAHAQPTISTDGVIESTDGGFKFPDGTVQTTAVPGLIVGADCAEIGDLVVVPNFGIPLAPQGDYRSCALQNLAIVVSQGTDLSGANLTNSEILLLGGSSRILFTGATLTGAELWGETPGNSSFDSAIMIGISGHSGAGVAFDSGQNSLVNADMSGADLTGYTFSFADLRGANLSGATFGVSSWSDSDLRNTNLSNADLTGANFSGSDLRGAQGTPISGDATWTGTLCPNGINSFDNENTCVGAFN